MENERCDIGHTTSSRETTADTTGASSGTFLPDLFTGSMSTSVKILVPQGRHGLQPSVEYLYRSVMASSYLGVGWSLELGDIERNTRFGIDYQADSYVYHSASGIIDLVSIGNDEYRAKIEGAFNRFRKVTIDDGSSAWEMTDRTGRKHSFGKSAASRQVDPANGTRIFRWSLDRVEDSHQNYLTVSYMQDQGQIYPDRIDYAGNRALKPSNSVRFIWENRPDPFQSFALDFSVITGKRLVAVDVFAAENRLRRYETTYDVSVATGRSVLKTITQESGDLTTKLPAWSFAYDDAAGWQKLPGVNGPLPALPVGNQCLTGNFNGDGRTDMACYTGGGGSWHVATLTAAGWQRLAGENGPLPALPVGNQCLTGDFNGDGRTDIACYTGGGGSWHVATLTAAGWQRLAGENGPLPALPVGNQCLTGDFNGDGRTDIACYTGSGGNWHVVTLTAAGWQTLPGGNGPLPALPVWNQCLTGDFNGDGRTDLACYTGSGGNWHVVTLTATGWQTLPGGNGPLPALPVGNQCLTGDFNGDGRTDMACYTGGGGNWHVVTLTAAGWQTLPGGGGPLPGLPIWQQCQTGDFNGDGRTDMACYSGNSGNWDVVSNSNIGTNLVATMKDAIGGTSTISYLPSSAFQNALLPIVLPTVSAISVDDGNGHTSRSTYLYSGGYFSLPERDFRGFGQVRISGPSLGDASSQRVDELFFHQGNDTAIDKNNPSDPVGYMKGKPYRHKVEDGSGNLLAQTTTEYLPDNTAPYFNPPVQVDIYTCDSGSCNKDVRTRYSYDNFGDIVQEEQFGDISSPDDDRTIVRAYVSNQSTWLIGLLSTETIYQGAGTSHELARTDYFYDGDNTCKTTAAASMPTTGDLARVSPSTGSDKHVIDTRMGYDQYGNLICKSDSLGRVATFRYDSSFTYLTTVTNALGQAAITQYYGVDGQPADHGIFGQPKTNADPNRAATTYSYDVLGRLIRQDNPDGSWMAWSYINIGDPKTQNIRTDSPAGLSEWTFLDGRGRTVLRKTTGPDRTIIATQYIYDVRGQLGRVSRPYFEGVEQPSFTQTTYDVLGRALQIQTPDGVVSRSCYRDWTAVFLDGNNHRIRHTKDAFGRLVLVQEYRGSYGGPCTTDETVTSTLPVSKQNSPYASTNYAFDAFGNLIAVTDARGNKTLIHYDRLNRRDRLVDVDSGEIDFVYDDNGNAVKQTSASGKALFLQYDALNRLVQKDFDRGKKLGKGDVTYLYDGPTTFGIGRLYQVRTKQVTKTFYYDSAGRVSRLDRKIGSRRFSTRWSFDGNDRLAAVDYTSGDSVSYKYNGPFLDRIFDERTTYVIYGGYLASGSPSMLLFGNGVSTQYIYGNSTLAACLNKDMKLCSLTVSGKDGKILEAFRYAYDLAGNTVAIGSSNTIRQFAYDESNRLIGEGWSTPPAAPNKALGAARIATEDIDNPRQVLTALSREQPGIEWKVGFAYDEIGNLVWSNDVGDYTYGGAKAGPHAVTRVGADLYAYDKDGNMVSGRGRALSYDAENNLSTVVLGSAATRLVYDEEGQRVAQTAGGISTTYSGNLEECRGNTCFRYIQAGDRLVARVGSASNIIYYHLDYQRSVSLVTDSTGSPAGEFEYGAYGDDKSVQNAIAISHRFTSQVLDGSTGLYFYGSRYYDAVLRRFVQPDTIVPYASNPQSLNRYSYALDNPVSLTDPDGHCPICIAIIIGAVIGGTEAAITHGNVLEGIARGAIIGGLTGGAGALAQGTSVLTQVAIESAAGAAASSANAVIFGGDVGRAALFGAVFGAGSAFAGTFGIQLFDSSGTGLLSAAAGTANELVTAGVQGAAIGGTFAGISGENVLEGAKGGATDWVIGELANMGIGHAFGFLASGFGAPRWENGAFKYDVSWMKEGGALGGWITFGNVISGSATGLDTGMYSPNSCPTYRDHEMGHVRQSTLYGRYYPIAAGISLISGAGWALARTAWTHENVLAGAHNYGALERYDNPAPQPLEGIEP